MTKKLIRNAAQCGNCGEIIESTHRHHAAHCECEDIMVDGGLDYSRMSWKTTATWVNLCLYNDEPHEIQREVLKWGTYGKNGDQPLTYKPVAKMSTAHIEAVLNDCSPKKVIKDCMEKELTFRKTLKFESVVEKLDKQ